ncbi:glutamate synthase large subunit [Chloroflexia bacterium SDU3-3]|nr:glutamate synthase large subunit [Chloroflexia bacterium SDU3-3]
MSGNELQPRGLYDPQFERDACGIGFVARLSAAPSHEIVQMALTAVGNMAHRGGVDADGKTGDGAGILTQIPRKLFARELARLGISYPIEDLAVGMLFMPQDDVRRAQATQIIKQALAEYDLELLGIREVPVNSDALGERARKLQPVMQQALIGRRTVAGSPLPSIAPEVYERALYLTRRTAEALARQQGLDDFYIPSLSCRTIIYKGMLISPLLPEFFLDLADPDYETALALYHQRYSTNTFPAWSIAQPFHMVSHNGEINTLHGNITWMRARASEWRRGDGPWVNGERRPTTENMKSAALAGGPPLASYVARLGPVLNLKASDSAMLDNTLELLVMGGRDIRHALTMLVPEAWERVHDMDPEWRAFYQYHSGLMEPWDGPAALCFSDGEVVGLALDRNGLRPARYLVTDDGLVVVGSEVGVVPVDEASIIRKGKVGPGQMIAADLRTGKFETNAEIKTRLARQQPYAKWLANQSQVLAPAGAPIVSYDEELETSSSKGAKSPLLGELQHAFGYTSEELAVVLRPMARDGQEPIGSMGDDTPPAVFSDRNRLLYFYFKQRFAEVTNPPIDPLREDLVMSLSCALGRRGNLLEETPDHAHLLHLHSPILTDEHLAMIRAHQDPVFASITLQATFPAAEGADAMQAAIDRLCIESEAAVAANKAILIISDRTVNEENAPIPALLAFGAVHQHLIRLGLRTSVSLIVESGEPREVHHLATLVGLGAEAVNPYVAMATVRALAVEREEVKGKAREEAKEARPAKELADEAESNFIHALEKGLLKVMSKMGIATVDSYCGAQVFETLGLAQEILDRCFRDVPGRLGGISFRNIGASVLARHDEAFANRLPHVAARTQLTHPGFYKFKKDGEYHAFSPAVVHALQKAATSGEYADYKAYSNLVHSRQPMELRDLLDFTSEALSRGIAVDEVEPIEAIMRRFSTAAMSLGSTSHEAHGNLAIAMNRIGAMSNSGEGGEDPDRFGTEADSGVKQVASGRFGVTPAYLSHAKELQIKMAQGSKPGEGGQLPGHKVTEEIARYRHTTPGIQLISPPPHHDIYSIEDLAQLIYDLKQVNPNAAISVKLVAEAGVGTVAAGVAKGGADVVLVSGNSGGTGASPLSSIKNAGVNMELGLAEAHQTLVINGLRGRVRLRADAGLKTGRDVVLAAILGADEFSFGTAALIAEGCIMARACHNNTCPVGIATQRPELRAKFPGTPRMVVNFFANIAEEIREILAALGARSLTEVIGRTELLAQIPRSFADSDRLNLSPLLAQVHQPGQPIHNTEPCNGLVSTSTLNEQLVADTFDALEHSTPVDVSYAITNVDRSFGATLSGAIGARYGDAGLPDSTITIRITGSAGQSFGVFNAAGVRMILEGEANDYVGKGMGGGTIVVRPSRAARYAAHENTIIGNTVLYGATGGELFAAGQAGERFGVRNSGAVAVVEGIGDHGCEYMTGGVVLVLGSTGRNFGAGMSGGIAYIYDEAGDFETRCNTDMVERMRLTPQDEENVRALLARHRSLTGSVRAAQLLSGWADVRGSFWAVRPRGMEVVTLPPTLIRIREKALV